MDVLDITSKQVEMLACKPRLEAESEVEIVVVLVTPVGIVVYSRRTKMRTSKEAYIRYVQCADKDDACQFNRIK